MRRGPGVGEPDALATLLVGADSLGPLGPRDPGAERECWGPELPAVPLNSSSGKEGLVREGREGRGWEEVLHMLEWNWYLNCIYSNIVVH